ncbi:hypothetical protein LOTGIDRAFT_164757 [Lottia gigantea]|uniref:Death domain-containing protein n=1 Tax=Lottia gigantea TaxID=225164 RepID=V4A8V5_LOTGI|nr:hypothetical protein LOTGIDRAFT_164757 [Lottia gigantea]ESO89736.1 hypothetical protein LOTGIDRAFT_164757 [Lottia gigantea]
MPVERKSVDHSHHGVRQPQTPSRPNKHSYHSNQKQPTQKAKVYKSGNSTNVKKSSNSIKKPQPILRAVTHSDEPHPEPNEADTKRNDSGTEGSQIVKKETHNEEQESRVSSRLSDNSLASSASQSSITSYTVNRAESPTEQPLRQARSVSATVRRIPPGEFDIKTFNSSISDYVELFSSPKFTKVETDYPVDDLISVVSEISSAIEDYKAYTAASQQHLEDLRNRMKTVKENVRMSVTRQAFQIQEGDDGYHSIEEKELTEKLAKLNAVVASANVDLAEAIRLSAETENTAVNAQLSTERARMEAEDIQEEIEFKAKVERERRAEQERIAEEERLKREEIERKEELARKAKEAEWKRREASMSDKIPICDRDDWPVYDMSGEKPTEDEEGEAPLICTVRCHPENFGSELLKCRVINQSDANLVFNDHEELVSQVIEVKYVHNEDEFKEPVYIGIPHFQTRAAASSREVVVKTDVGGSWIELPTREVSFESRKDVKMAQAEVKQPGILVVVSRFKQDYVTLSPKPCKVVSSFDQRITFSFPKEAVFKNQHLLIQVQTVDSASVHDYKARDSDAKGLLTSSHIVHMDWDSGDIEKPVTITLPCPPNPAKAKKLAQIRKMKEEKMKNPKVVPKTLAEMEKEEEKKKKRQANRAVKQKEAEEGEEEDDVPMRKTQNRWYMGEYASTDDDENDLLHFLMYNNGRWFVEPEVEISSTKIDLVTFNLPRACERFMVIRTRTNIAEESIPPIATGLSKYLAKRFVQVILRQKTDDPFKATLTVCPASRSDKTLKKLTEEGYEESPSAALQVCVSEGDTIEVKFRGNVTCGESDTHLSIPYNTHVHSQLYFSVSEVDKYLQKNFPMYRGLVQVFRKYKERKAVIKTIGRRQEDDSDKPPEIKEEILCELLISIPKYHIEPNAIPVKAPIKIHNTKDPVNEDTMKDLAVELGDEWKKVAHYLNVNRIRLQSILRDMNIGERTFDEAKFDMLMTWLKRVPKAADKVSILAAALIKSGRSDLAEHLRSKEREYHRHQPTPQHEIAAN